MVVCLYNTAPAAYLTAGIEGRPTIERIADYLEEIGAPGDDDGSRDEASAGEAAPRTSADRAGTVERIVVYSTVELASRPEGWDVRLGDPLSEVGLTELLAELTQSAESEILFSFVDQPFLNVELTRRLLGRHRMYRAEYTFADGYPQGLAPEIVSGRAVSHLRSLATDDAIGRGGLFPIVAKDINRLDVETELSSVDQRLLRLELAVDSRANLELCRRLAPGAPRSIDEWAHHVQARRVEHRTRPRFVCVQVVEQEVQSLAYSPYPRIRANVLDPGLVMDRERFGGLVSEVAEFSPEAVVQLSLWGEVALHPEAIELVKTILATGSLAALVETSGVGWPESARTELFSIDSDRLTVIVGLDSNDRSVYESVRGAGFDEAQAFAREAVARLGKRAYVQAVRSQLTEPALDAFYREWKELTPNIIIQKYDHFAGLLSQIKVGDISPLERFPCWHLQRDLYVLADGTVTLCREDVERTQVLGNAFDDGVPAVWEAGRHYFEAHVNERYPAICGECDEYYTFTF